MITYNSRSILHRCALYHMVRVREEGTMEEPCGLYGYQKTRRSIPDLIRSLQEDLCFWVNTYHSCARARERERTRATGWGGVGGLCGGVEIVLPRMSIEEYFKIKKMKKGKRENANNYYYYNYY